MRRSWLFLLLLGAQSLMAQVWIHIGQGEKASYRPGDTLQLTLQVKTLHETCKEGMRQAKVFVSAMEILQQDDWVMKKPGLWEKRITVRMEKSSKPVARITVQRKVDKERLFLQKEFPLEGP
jgi:hypothetical protein